MSEINKNVTVTEQYYSAKKGPLDAKLTPADDYAELTDLTRIPRSERYVGLAVTVLNSGSPVEYWLIGGTANKNWKIKAGNIVPDKASLLAISTSACTVGLEMIVQVDESNDNKLTKYHVSEIDGGNVVWTKEENGSAILITGDDVEPENQ